jgi:hypothetical protein
MRLLYRVNCTFSAKAPRTIPKKWPNYLRIFIKTTKIFILIPCFRRKQEVFGFYIDSNSPQAPAFLLSPLPTPIISSTPPRLTYPQYPVFSFTCPSFPSLRHLSILSLRLLSTVPPSPLFYPSASFGFPPSLSKSVCSMSPSPLFPVLIFQSEDEIRDDCFSLAHCSKIIDHGWTFLHQK